jgi:hypothetical protein
MAWGFGAGVDTSGTSISRTLIIGNPSNVGTQYAATEDSSVYTLALRATFSAYLTAVTLVGNALSPAPALAPAQIKLMVLWKDLSGAAVLNTDFTAEATRDGSTWTTGTLTDTGLTISGFKVLWTEVNVSAQPNGTNVKYRLKTLNAKYQQVKGVALTAK